MAEFVLVQGTTQSPAGWGFPAARLRARSHQVTAVDLAAIQPQLPAAGYADVARHLPATC